MAERPILFSGPLVRAILDGRKTVTRRPVTRATSVAYDVAQDPIPWPEDVEAWRRISGDVLAEPAPHAVRYVTPRVHVGDTLWVRETHGIVPESLVRPFDPKTGHGCSVLYRATDGEPDPSVWEGWRWTPSIHMPKWASRITLRVTDVRVERVQEIDDGGALAEGVDGIVGGEECPVCEGSGDFEDDPDPGCLNCASSGRVLLPRDTFARLWDGIYGGRECLTWSANPWVWVIEFERA